MAAAGTHAQSFRQEPFFPGEKMLLAEIVRPGMRALDVGCAATGRTARLLRELGCTVHSIDIAAAALAEFADHPARAEIHLTAADMCALPFASGTFDLVLIAFHAIDYLLTDALRHMAFQEVNRVLAPHGAFVFSSLNRIGALLSPGNLRRGRDRKSMMRHLLRLDFLKQTLVDVNGLTLYQAYPKKTIAQVEMSTDLKFMGAINPSGTSRNLTLLTLFAIGPYYLFMR